MGGAVFDLKSPKNTTDFLSMHQSDGAKNAKRKGGVPLAGTPPPLSRHVTDLLFLKFIMPSFGGCDKAF